jgi:hypothetical protein
MLKFFRKIRQNLLMENKTGKYIKYALGEIVLVVIGILIALSINNWNEKEKSRDSEKLLLTNLKEEFNFNLIQLKQTKNQIDNSTGQLVKLINLFGTKTDTLGIDYLNKLINDGLWGPMLKSNQDIFNSIYDNGKMDLVSNPELRKMLLAWGSQLEHFEHTQKNMSINLNRNVLPKMEKLISLRNSDNFSIVKGVEGGSKIMTDNRVILSNLEAENVFFDHVWELENVASLYPNLSIAIEEIIAQLEK